MDGSSSEIALCVQKEETLFFFYPRANVCQSNLLVMQEEWFPPKVLNCDEILKDTEGKIIVLIVHGWYMRKSDATCVKKQCIKAITPFSM